MLIVFEFKIRNSAMTTVGHDMMQRFLRSLTAAFIAASIAVLGVAHTWADDSPPPPKLRLPADVAAPVRYRMELTVIPDQDTFTGTVEIDLRFAKPTSLLWLNAEKLTVKEATLTVGTAKLDAKVIAQPKDYIGFAFAHPVGPGEATVRVMYEGQINRKDGRGIFQRKDGDQWYVYTQFEEIAARQAFPCFDEPGYKVPWQLILHVKKNQEALSNTPIASETNTSHGMKTVKFAETKPLPSYLVAFSVGDFEIVEAGTAGKKNTPVRIAVPRGRAAEAKYAAKTTPAIVGLLENYFGIPYPYEKLDQVAVPTFGGAMENAGQITYGVSIILAKADQDTPQRQRNWVWIAAHELAHQWSGDLVTTAWWDDIWLNEGFANWAADKIVNEYHPEWQWNVEMVNSTQGAMVKDSLVSARRVRQTIESADDIANAFDNITYDKGDALLYMFESYLGADRFREGVRRYLSKYSWKNATSADFLTALSGNDPAIASAFSSFLDQPGVPLITVSIDCNKRAAIVELSQQRFLPLGSPGAAPQLWKVPVCLHLPMGSDERRECLLLDQPGGLIPLPKATSCPAWVAANAGADGYYRVLYQGELLRELLKDDARVLSGREKVALIGDMSALTSNGKLPLRTALALAPNLARDSSRHVITKTLEITTDPKGNLVPPYLLSQHRQYLEDLYVPRARQLSWRAKPGESEDDRFLRPAILDVVANQAEDPDLVAQAKSLAPAWLDDRKVVAPDMVATVLNTAARHGDQALFDRLRVAAKQEKDEDIQSKLLNAMGLFPQPEIAKAAFSVLLSDEFNVRQSIAILFAASDSPKTRNLAYDFVKENWDALIAKFPTDWGAFMPFVAGTFCDEQHRHDVADFFEGRSTKYSGGPRNLAQTLEGIDLCVAYKKAQQPSLAEFLERYGKVD
jgi:alanyl aminopeptidase